MGLDQNAYKVTRHADNTDFFYPEDAEKEELSCWRKHPNLEGWMEKVYNLKADAQEFGGQTEFPTEIIASAVKVDESKLTEEDKETLLQVATTDQEMQQTIMAASFAAMAANLHKQRVFNCQPVRLTVGDLDQLEMHVRLETLPDTVGFFFGEDSDDEYRKQDLKFIEDARKAIEDGYDVYYQSWW